MGYASEEGGFKGHLLLKRTLHEHKILSCEVRLVGSLGLVAKGRLQFTSEPPLARALQLD